MGEIATRFPAGRSQVALSATSLLCMCATARTCPSPGLVVRDNYREPENLLIDGVSEAGACVDLPRSALFASVFSGHTWQCSGPAPASAAGTVPGGCGVLVIQPQSAHARCARCTMALALSSSPCH